MTGAALSMWVVYDHPRDFPDVFIAREHIAIGEGTGPTGNVLVSPDLDTIRNHLELKGLVKLDRHPDDDAVILEVWL